MDTKVSIGIATCLRPNSLARLLASLARLKFSHRQPEISVYVIDNDANRSAQAPTEAARASFPFALHYLVEARRGIPFARNLFVKEALSKNDWLAFIDDDEQAEPCWLDELLEVAQKFGADTVAGPVLRQFEESPPDWAAIADFYNDPPFATGENVVPVGIGNALVRSAVFRQLPVWFDENHPLMGGEDFDFFRRVARAGFKQVWASGAIVHETVFRSRATLGWLMRRQFRYGNTSAWILLAAENPVRAGLKTLLLSAHRLAQAAALTVRSILCGKTAKTERIKALQHAFFAAGLFTGLLGSRYREYRTIHGD